jgi:hypothetical protein
MSLWLQPDCGRVRIRLRPSRMTAAKASTYIRPYQRTASGPMATATGSN